MARWEYYRLPARLDEKTWIIEYQGKEVPYRELTRLLNEMGANGWELVSVTTDVSTEAAAGIGYTFTTREAFYLKRQLPD
jgi:hypothetical protein